MRTNFVNFRADLSAKEKLMVPMGTSFFLFKCTEIAKDLRSVMDIVSNRSYILLATRLGFARVAECKLTDVFPTSLRGNAWGK